MEKPGATAESEKLIDNNGKAHVAGEDRNKVNRSFVVRVKGSAELYQQFASISKKDITIIGTWRDGEDSLDVLDLTEDPSNDESQESIKVLCHPRTSFALTEGIRQSEDVGIMKRFVTTLSSTPTSPSANQQRPSQPTGQQNSPTYVYIIVNQVQRKRRKGEDAKPDIEFQWLPFLFHPATEDFQQGQLHVIHSTVVEASSTLGTSEQGTNEEVAPGEENAEHVPDSSSTKPSSSLSSQQPPPPTRSSFDTTSLNRSLSSKSRMTTPSQSSSSKSVIHTAAASTTQKASTDTTTTVLDEPVVVPKHIRFGYLRKPDQVGFWVSRMVVFDSRQRSLIYASFDRTGALMQPEHIYFSQITRVQLSVYSHRQFEIDVQSFPNDLVRGNQIQTVIHRFLCDEDEDASEWIALLHKASPRLAQSAPLPSKPVKPPPLPVNSSRGDIGSTPVAPHQVAVPTMTTTKKNKLPQQSHPLPQTRRQLGSSASSTQPPLKKIPPPPPPHPQPSLVSTGLTGKKAPPPPPPPPLVPATTSGNACPSPPPPPSGLQGTSAPQLAPLSKASAMKTSLDKVPPPPPPTLQHYVNYSEPT